MSLLGGITKLVGKLPVVGKAIAKVIPSSIQDIGLQGIAKNLQKTLAASAVASAPVVKQVLSATVVKPVSTTVNYALGSPLNFIKATGAAGVVAGGGLAVVPKIFTAAKTVTQEALPVVLGEKPLTKENVGSVIKAGATAVGIGAVGVGAALLVEKALDTKDKVTEAVLPSADTSQLPTTGTGTPSAPAQPLTPATQVLGTPVSTGTTSRRKKAKKQVSNGQRITVNVINANQSRLQTNRNYLNTRGLKALQ